MISALKERYVQKSTYKLRAVDMFILFTFALTAIQVTIRNSSNLHNVNDACILGHIYAICRAISIQLVSVWGVLHWRHVCINRCVVHWQVHYLLSVKPISSLQSAVVSLRFHLSSKSFAHVTSTRAILEYVFCSFVIFFFCILFLG